MHEIESLITLIILVSVILLLEKAKYTKLLIVGHDETALIMNEKAKKRKINSSCHLLHGLSKNYKKDHDEIINPLSIENMTNITGNTQVEVRKWVRDISGKSNIVSYRNEALVFKEIFYSAYSGGNIMVCSDNLITICRNLIVCSPVSQEGYITRLALKLDNIKEDGYVWAKIGVIAPVKKVRYSIERGDSSPRDASPRDVSSNNLSQGNHVENNGDLQSAVTVTHKKGELEIHRDLLARKDGVYLVSPRVSYIIAPIIKVKDGVHHDIINNYMLRLILKEVEGEYKIIDDKRFDLLRNKHEHLYSGGGVYVCHPIYLPPISSEATATLICMESILNRLSHLVKN